MNYTKKEINRTSLKSYNLVFLIEFSAKIKMHLQKNMQIIKKLLQTRIAANL